MTTGDEFDYPDDAWLTPDDRDLPYEFQVDEDDAINTLSSACSSYGARPCLGDPICWKANR